MKKYMQSTWIPAIKRWLSPPVFDGDPEKTRRAGLLNLFVVAGLLFTLLSMVGIVLGRNVPVQTLMLDMGFFLLLFLFRLMLYRGKIGLLMFCLTAPFFLHLTALNVTLGTIRTPTAAMYLFWMIIMGLLFQWRGIVMSTVASSLAILGLIVAENVGLLPKPNYSVGITQWIVSTCLFGMTAALTYHINQITRH